MLRLAAGALGVHHHFARDVAGDVVAEIRSIMASARSMPAVMPAEVQIAPSCTWMRSASTRTLGKSRASCAARAPVRGGALAVEQAGRGQHERAGADAGDAARARGRVAERAQQHGIGHRCARAAAADDDQRVGARARAQRLRRSCARRTKRQPAPAVLADEAQRDRRRARSATRFRTPRSGRRRRAAGSPGNSTDFDRERGFGGKGGFFDISARACAGP